MPAASSTAMRRTSRARSRGAAGAAGGTRRARCECDGYASDITRAYPVSGRFSGEQKAIYELVLAAQLACIDAVQPGRMFHDYHEVAERVLAQGPIDLKLCEGTLEGVLESGAYKQFYMHRAGHWLLVRVPAAE